MLRTSKYLRGFNFNTLNVNIINTLVNTFKVIMLMQFEVSRVVTFMFLWSGLIWWIRAHFETFCVSHEKDSFCINCHNICIYRLVHRLINWCFCPPTRTHAIFNFSAKNIFHILFIHHDKTVISNQFHDRMQKSREMNG